MLPCAVIMTIYLVVTAAVSGHPQWQSIGLLASILGLPGILILVTTRKLIYICWMISKLIAAAPKFQCVVVLTIRFPFSIHLCHPSMELYPTHVLILALWRLFMGGHSCCGRRWKRKSRWPWRYRRCIRSNSISDAKMARLGSDPYWQSKVAVQQQQRSQQWLCQITQLIGSFITRSSWPKCYLQHIRAVSSFPYILALDHYYWTGKPLVSPWLLRSSQSV